MAIQMTVRRFRLPQGTTLTVLRTNRYHPDQTFAWEEANLFYDRQFYKWLILEPPGDRPSTLTLRQIQQRLVSEIRSTRQQNFIGALRVAAENGHVPLLQVARADGSTIDLSGLSPEDMKELVSRISFSQRSYLVSLDKLRFRKTVSESLDAFFGYFSNSRQKSDHKIAKDFYMPREYSPKVKDLQVRLDLAGGEQIEISEEDFSSWLNALRLPGSNDLFAGANTWQKRYLIEASKRDALLADLEKVIIYTEGPKIEFLLEKLAIQKSISAHPDNETNHSLTEEIRSEGDYLKPHFFNDVRWSGLSKHPDFWRMRHRVATHLNRPSLVGYVKAAASDSSTAAPSPGENSEPETGAREAELDGSQRRQGPEDANIAESDEGEVSNLEEEPQTRTGYFSSQAKALRFETRLNRFRTSTRSIRRTLIWIPWILWTSAIAGGLYGGAHVTSYLLNDAGLDFSMPGTTGGSNNPVYDTGTGDKHYISPENRGDGRPAFEVLAASDYGQENLPMYYNIASDKNLPPAVRADTNSYYEPDDVNEIYIDSDIGRQRMDLRIQAHLETLRSDGRVGILSMPGYRISALEVFDRNGDRILDTRYELYEIPGNGLTYIEFSSNRMKYGRITYTAEYIRDNRAKSDLSSMSGLNVEALGEVTAQLSVANATNLQAELEQLFATDKDITVFDLEQSFLFPWVLHLS